MTQHRGRIHPNNRIHLIDIENLIGNPRPTEREVTAAAAVYAKVAGVRDGDQYVVACNHGAAATVAFGWPEARVLQRSGEDGADLALIDVIAHERIAERFGSVVIGSGDGIFAEAAAWLQGQGVSVTVVSRVWSLARRLRLAVNRVLYFDGALPPADVAASEAA